MPAYRGFRDIIQYTTQPDSQSFLRGDGPYQGWTHEMKWNEMTGMLLSHTSWRLYNGTAPPMYVFNSKCTVEAI